MSKRFLFICLSAVVPLLAGCTSQNAELPDPSELYAAIADAAELPEMYRIPQELISDYYGIEPDWYISIVAYKCQDILRPDEIVIVKAVSEKAAEDVMARLEAWMAYKEKSAENYFSETVSSIHNGVIRQDGLTVSLLVASDIDSVINVFDSL